MARGRSDEGSDLGRDRCKGLDGAVAVLLVTGRFKEDIDWESAPIGEIMQHLAAAKILEMPAGNSGGVVITVPQDKLIVVAVRRNPEEEKVTEVPRYEQDAHVLLWRGQVVRHWTRKASRQQVVLAAFERAGWPECIANPFAAMPGVDAKELLHQTVNDLNAGLDHCSLRFHRDGHGGVRWGVEN